MDYLGLDNLFVSILQVLNLSELGLSSAIVYCMYAPIAENNVKVVNAYYGFIKKAYQIIGVLVLFLGVLIIPILPHLIRGNVPSDINLYILFFVYLFNAVISYFYSHIKMSCLVLAKELIFIIILCLSAGLQCMHCK